MRFFVFPEFGFPKIIEKIKKKINTLPVEADFSQKDEKNMSEIRKLNAKLFYTDHENPKSVLDVLYDYFEIVEFIKGAENKIILSYRTKPSVFVLYNPGRKRGAIYVDGYYKINELCQYEKYIMKSKVQNKKLANVAYSRSDFGSFGYEELFCTYLNGEYIETHIIDRSDNIMSSKDEYVSVTIRTQSEFGEIFKDFPCVIQGKTRVGNIGEFWDFVHEKMSDYEELRKLTEKNK